MNGRSNIWRWVLAVGFFVVGVALNSVPRDVFQDFSRSSGYHHRMGVPLVCREQADFPLPNGKFESVSPLALAVNLLIFSAPLIGVGYRRSCNHLT